MNKKILKLLENNARMTNEDIAAVTGLDEKEVAERIAEMEMRGVIRGYKGIIDPEQTQDSSVSAIIMCSCCTSACPYSTARAWDRCRAAMVFCVN